MKKNNPIKFYNVNYWNLLKEKIKKQPKQYTTVKGKITDIKKDLVFVDVGLKSEGKIMKNELLDLKYKISDLIEVYIENLENKNGCTEISIERVIKEKIWNHLKLVCQKEKSVDGKIVGKVSKGGFAVKIDRILAFLPTSQLDTIVIDNPSQFYNTDQKFKILKLDRKKGNVVVSRKKVLENLRKTSKDIFLSKISEGIKLKGIVKSMAPYGAFINLGDMDGLLHITDVCWNKISHPAEKLTIGESLDVIVIKYNEETKRISLGLKQLKPNPWENIKDKYQIGQKLLGKICEFHDYGIFVELEKNFKGLVHINEVCWEKKNISLKKMYKSGDKVDVEIIGIDINKHRINLSIKRCMKNPWANIINKYKINEIVKAKIIRVEHFGLFVNIIEGKTVNNLDILVPASEIINFNYKKRYKKKYKIGSVIKGVIKNKDFKNEQMTISIKKYDNHIARLIIKDALKKKIHNCQIKKVKYEGLLVSLSNGVNGCIKRHELSKKTRDKIIENFSIGEKLNAKPLYFDRKNLLHLSVKQLEVDEEKEILYKYSSINNTPMLGDMLKEAFKKNKK